MSRDEIKQYRTEISYYRKFVNAILVLVDNESPEFNSYIKEIFAKFSNSLDCEERLVDGYERMTEDFNDVAERFCVVYRCSVASSEAKSKVKEYKSKVDKLKGELDNDDVKKKDKIKAELEKAIQCKKDAIKNAEERIQDLIDEKDKYNKFKVKRLKHAYTYMGDVMSETMKNAKDEITEMEKLCIKLKENVDQILNGNENSPVEVEEKNIEEQEDEAYKKFNDTIPVINDTYNADYSNIPGMPNFD